MHVLAARVTGPKASMCNVHLVFLYIFSVGQVYILNFQHESYCRLVRTQHIHLVCQLCIEGRHWKFLGCMREYPFKELSNRSKVHEERQQHSSSSKPDVAQSKTKPKLNQTKPHSHTHTAIHCYQFS